MKTQARGWGRLWWTCAALLLLVGLSAGVAAANTTIYRYTDKEGNHYFTDDLNKVPAQYRDSVEDVSTKVREQAEEQVLLEPSETEKGFLDGLDSAFEQAGAKPLSLSERNGFILLSRTWGVPGFAAAVFYVLAGLVLLIYAIWNKDWWWVLGGVAWNVALMIASSLMGPQLLEQPVLYATLTVAGAAAPIAYAYVKVAEDRPPHVRMVLPALFIAANGIVFMAVLDLIEWFGPLVKAHPEAFPGL